MKFKKLILIFLSAIIAFCLTACASPLKKTATINTQDNSKAELFSQSWQKSDNDILEISDENFVLSLNSSDGSFTVKHKDTDKIWKSNPEIKDNDSLTNSLGKVKLQSQLLVSFFTDKNVESENSSAVGSVKKGGLTVYKGNNAIKCEYKFVNEQAVIPIVYSFDKYGLSVDLDLENIIEDEKYLISSISILPYFSAISSEREGNILLPDGCGTLINLTKNYDDYSNLNYRKSVYGQDPLLGFTKSSSKTEDIHIPIFGLIDKTAKQAMMGIITSGDANSYITMYGEGNQSSFNTVFPMLNYRQGDTITLYEGTDSELSSFSFVKEAISLSFYSVKYFLFADEDVTYSQMADAATQYYKETLGITELSEKEHSFNLNVIGSVRQNENILGIPVKNTTALTSFNDCSVILNSLSQNNVKKIKVYYDGFWKGGLNDLYPVEANRENALGSSEDYNNLIKIAEKQDAKIIPKFDLLNIYKTSVGFLTSSYGSSGVSGATKKIYSELELSTGYSDKLSLIKYILKPEYIESNYKKFIANAVSNEYLALNDTGISNLSANFPKDKGSNITDRNETKLIHINAMKNASQELEMYSVENFFLYMLPYIDSVSELPIKSSGIINSEDIPFLQLIVGRFLNYSCLPLNEWPDSEIAMLKMLEYGADLSVNMSGVRPSSIENSDVLINTGYYKDWLDLSSDIGNQIYKINSALENGVMISHTKVDTNVYCCEYNNGMMLYINYGENVYNIDGTVISPMSAIVK